MDCKHWNESHKARRSAKSRLWPSASRKKRNTKKNKENVTSDRLAKSQDIGYSYSAQHDEEMLVELNLNEMNRQDFASRLSTPENLPSHTKVMTTAEIVNAGYDDLVMAEIHSTTNITPDNELGNDDIIIAEEGLPSNLRTEIESRNEDKNLESNVQSFSRNLSPSSTTTSTPLIVEIENSENIQPLKLSGRRIMDVKYLFDQISSIDHSPFHCTFKDLKFVSEIRLGFYSTFQFECKICGVKEILKSDSLGRELNQNVIQGTVSSGSGFSQLDEFCAHLEIPCMSDKTFMKEDMIFGNIIKDIALDSMYQAGSEAKKGAIAKGHVDVDGIPYITVVVDGSWAKRSYRSNYNSLSGVACIIGFETKKVLFLGVRNTYCCVCNIAKSKDTTPKEHKCFKNWGKSSTAMEADGIVEGFKCSIDMHGLKFNNVIGDGDSSVISALNEALPYGHSTIIKKVECSNHLLRNYCTKLKTLTKKTENKHGSVPVTLRKKLESNILRLRRAIKGAVEHNAKVHEMTLPEKIKNLEEDILNSPCHVFGNHENCKLYFCKRPTGENLVPEMKQCGLWYDIYSIMSNIIMNVESLLTGQTNNIAEQYNAIVAKFLGGKRINYCLRGSYERRCYAAAAKHNTGNLIKTLQKQTEHMPGTYAKSYVKRQESKNKRKADTNRHSKRWKIKAAPADEHYGDLENEADMDMDRFEKIKNQFLTELNQSALNINAIEKKTVGQGANQEWMKQRKIRLTASMFGKICKLRPTTSCKNVVKQLLYSTFQGNYATRYGNKSEPLAIKEIEKVLELHIVPCGLFIDERRPHLGASPDGLIGEDTLIEIKCPANAAVTTPFDAIKEKKITFCTTDGDEPKIKLKRNHNFFYQVQGQLQITKRQYCIFVIWTPKGLAYEKIEKDDSFWNSIVGKLDDFYFKCILPELLDPRLPRNLPIRDRI